MKGQLEEMCDPSGQKFMRKRNKRRKVAILSIHPLFDTRIANHMSTLVEHGYRVSYINWSRPATLPRQEHLQSVRLIHRAANPEVGLNPFMYGWMLLWFAQRAIGARADLYHIHDAILLPLAVLLKLLLRKRVVFDVHEHYLRESGIRGWYYQLCYKCCLTFVDGVVAVSNSTLPVTPKPHAVVPNYQNRSDFEPYMREKQADDRSLCVVYFGGLYSEFQDVGMMLRLAETMLCEHEGVRFNFGGVLHGPDATANRARFESLADQYPDRFSWFGVMPRDEVIRHTATADVGLLFLKARSLNVTGASPHKVFEYMSVGAAIFATEGFVVAGEIKNAGAGELFPADVDAATVAASLSALVKDPARLERMKRASAALGKKYSWQAVQTRYVDLYNELMRGV